MICSSRQPLRALRLPSETKLSTCPQLSTLLLEGFICNSTACDSIGSSETNERKRLQLAHSIDRQATLQSRPADNACVSIILLGFSTTAYIFCQLVFQLQCTRISCISSLLAFIHLLPACMHARLLSCMVVSYYAFMLVQLASRKR